MVDRVAILAGNGTLPVLLHNALPHSVCVVFRGASHHFKVDHSFIEARFERLGELFETLKSKGITKIVLAGSMHRPDLDPYEFDDLMRGISTQLGEMLCQGDDALLRFVLKLFDQHGFSLVGAAQVVPDLVAESGMLTGPHEVQNEKDIYKADQLLALMSSADIGQAVVVENGLVLGVETLQGTDRLLQFVAETDLSLRDSLKKGVLVKRPKKQQDLRVDMPAIGPNTIDAVSKAGLAGIVISPLTVLLLEREKTLSLAAQKDIFIMARDPI